MFVRTLWGVYVKLINACVEPVDACVEPVDACVEPVDVCVEPVDACVEPVDACVETVWSLCGACGCLWILCGAHDYLLYVEICVGSVNVYVAPMWNWWTLQREHVETLKPVESLWMLLWNLWGCLCEDCVDICMKAGDVSIDAFV